MSAKPFCKYVGGKRQLLPHILPLLPAVFGRYYEPFVGGGAVYFALRAQGRAERAVLGDANHRLIDTYEAIRSDVGDVIARLQHLAAEYARRGEEHFLEVRRARIDANDVPYKARAAWLLYLNKTAFYFLRASAATA